MTPEARAVELERLYRSMRSELQGFLRKQVRDPAVVEDLLHDVFLKIHAGRDRVRDPARLPAWIYRIARNVVHDFRRRRRPAEALDDGHVDRLAAPEVEEEMIRRLTPSVRMSITRLPPLYRRALVESDLKGTPQKELAATLGLSYSGLKSRVQRARRMVHEMLLECCHFELDARGGVIDYRPRKGCCRCDSAECREATAKGA
jgi:RNA polymerase sigma-70 factor (ECF subfamily)